MPCRRPACSSPHHHPPIQVLKSNYEDVPDNAADAMVQERDQSLMEHLAGALRVEAAGAVKANAKNTGAIFNKDLMSNKYFALSIGKCLRKSLNFGLSRF